MKKSFLLNLIFLVAVLLGCNWNVTAQNTSVFNYTGGVQTYTVPAGVTKLWVDAVGARGGVQYYYNRPGYGGRVTCMMTVTPGQVLNIYVGGVGQGSSYPSPICCQAWAGGFNGGGAGYYYGGGGGGATDIRIGGVTLTDRKVVAGGGGGAGYNSCCSQDYDRGGDGGGLTGERAFSGGSNTGTGGGGGGTQSGGGAAAILSCSATAGALGLGGTYTSTCYSGGGGGGYYGGGGGSYSGGGGGSSYTDAGLCTSVTHFQGVNGGSADATGGNGVVRITPMNANSMGFVSTGALQTYTVPAGVNYLVFDVEGGSGGSNNQWPHFQYKSRGGRGGRVQCVRQVSTGQVFNIYVGDRGKNGSMAPGSYNGVAGTGGYNGGGNGAVHTSYSPQLAGGGGGGASDVRFGGTNLTDRVIVAGGGGGAGQYPNTTDNSSMGGAGGGLTGGSGVSNAGAQTPATGGTQAGGGVAAPSGSNGTSGIGGNATANNGAGGGGGGYWGGGSGGTSYFSGGGGGSSMTTSDNSGVTHTQDYNLWGSGRVIVFAGSPTVVSDVATLAFGGVGVGTSSPVMTTILTGSFLSGSSVVITPPTGYIISPDGSSWYSASAPLTYTYVAGPAGGSFTIPLQVQFQPTSIASFPGNITITGGGLSATVNIALTGNGVTACSSTPTGGTATINGSSSASGSSSTTFNLTASGMTSSAVTYQWQTATASSGPYTDIPGANTVSYAYTGLTVNRWFRLNTTCASFGTASSSTVTATFVLPVSGCVPTGAANGMSSYYCGYGTANPFVITALTTLTDVNSYSSTPYYHDMTGSMSFSAAQGGVYRVDMNSTNCWTTGAIWIDFNDNGSFDNTTELVGGYSAGYFGFYNCTGVRPTFNITIPAGATLGAHRLRAEAGYTGANTPSPTSTTYPGWPYLPPCPASPTQYADTRDYICVIAAPSPTVTATPSSITFGAVTTNTASAPLGFSRLTGANLLPVTSGPLTITSSSSLFLLSTNGVSWGSSVNVIHSGGTFAGNVYVQFTPTVSGSASGSISVTGGGLASAVAIPVFGTGASACSGTPGGITAAVNPSTAASTSAVTLSASGGGTGNLKYQWQSSSSSSGPFTDMPGAITTSHTFTGVSSTTYYRVNVTCPTGGTAPSNVVSVSPAPTTAVAHTCGTIPAPTINTYCCGFYVADAGYPFFVGGDAGTAINDATYYGSWYLDQSSTVGCNISAGGTYTVRIGGTGSNMNSFQMWIDYDGNGTFSAGESVCGVQSWIQGSALQTTTFTVPNTVTAGTYRLRAIVDYTGGSSTGSPPTYPVYPNIPVCGTGIGYYQMRDYKVTVSGVVCSGTPVAGIANPDPTFGCSSFAPYVYGVGATTGVSGLTYQWQSSTTGPFGTYSDISGATGQGYIAPTMSAGSVYYRRTTTCTASGLSATTNGAGATYVIPPNISNFTSPTATNSCSGSGSTVTVNSTSLGTATFTVTYNLSGANTSTNNSAVLTMGSSNGTFSIPNALLSSLGSTTVTITSLSSGGCSTTVSASNTANFIVGTLPNITNFTSPSATSICAGLNSTATVNSTTLGAGTFTVTYGLGAPNASTGNTATLTMGASNGTFAIPGALLSAAGSTALTINSISNSSGCSVNTTINNTASFNVGANSVAYNMTGGGSYCTGGTGLPIGISTSTTGNNYQLYNGASPVSGALVAGTGAAISFGNMTATGTYTVLSTNTTSACTRGSTGTSVINITGTPVVYSMTGGGNYCAGGTGVNINLSSSDALVTYVLYLGATGVATVTGTGGTPVGFGLQTGAGSYIVIANPGTTCATTMSGSATVVVNPLPTAYSVTGGGNYCAGGSGSPVGVSFGASGVLYDLKLGAATVTSAAGTNATLGFGNQTVAGTYSVLATVTSTGCSGPMSGTVTIGTNPVPTAQTVTGGGNYCSGGTGMPVGVGASQSGVTYQLYNGSTAVSGTGGSVAGTGSAVSFGNQTASGIYSVVGALGSCTTAMTGTATIVMNATPTVFTVTGGGNYCSGGAGSVVGLNGSVAGTNYMLYNGSTLMSTVAGTGAAISFGSFTAAGTYTVAATTTATTCSANMSGAVVIAINSLPNVYTVTGGGNYCIGGSGYAVNLSGSQTSPITTYQLYRSGVPVGGPITGTGFGLTFGTFTDAGIYTVVANTAAGCTSVQSGSATINVNPLPTVYPVTGGGNYCAGGTGVTIGIGGSQSGIVYSLFNGATLAATVNGLSSGAPVNFGLQTGGGTYTVFANNSSTTCTNNMSGTATIGINPLPTAFAVTGTGSYCAGGTGVAVGLASSTAGVNYTLFASGSPVGTMAGTGSAINFGNMTAAGTYTVSAVNPSTTCAGGMSGNATVTVNTPPNQYSVSSSGTNYCAGGTGITIGLLGSQAGVDYQLYMGSTPSGAPVSGTGSSISFGNRTIAGTYTVVATNTTTSCTRNMSGSASITIDALPTVYGVTGGGNYCAGSTGVNISQSGSQSGVLYQLYNGAAAVGGTVPGTGGALSFGTFTTAGTYTVLASSTTSVCTSNMSGAATVVMNTLPNAYAITSSGTNYCAGTTGISIGVANSTTGVNYQLYNGATAIGSPVPGSTGAAISFGSQTMAGTYTAVGMDATTGCTRTMTGTATISINPAPTVYTVTGGGNYCAGSTGVDIILNGSNSGINYQLYNGSLAVGGPVAGTGAALNFGTYTTSGTYVIVASNGTTSCTSNMASSATVGINPLPTTFAVTGGGSYCNGGTGLHVGLGGSTAGIAYQLYNGSTPVGSLVSGTGLALDFGIKTDAGSYTVIGYNPATTCSASMMGSATIVVNSLPAVHTVTGGGSYCNGSTTGVNIGLSSSTPGTSYQLYNGSATAGGPVFGTGDPLDFGAFTGTGTYSVLATGVSTSCPNAMSGTATIGINPLPVVQTVTGGGVTCQGGTGVNVYLNNSTTGVNYQLYNSGAPVGAPVPGTGSMLSFGPQTAAGSYTVSATNATTSCSRNMSGSASVLVNPQPTAQTVMGGGSYCSGDAGMPISLGGSQSGISYQLMNGTTTVGSPVIGTGGIVNFGMQTASGNYTVLGTNTTTTCNRTMTGSATISINSLPVAYTVTGGGSLCNGAAGVNIVLSGSNTGISYQLVSGSTSVGGSVAGTGGPLVFGPVATSGTYMVIATNGTTSCTNYMSGSATVNVSSLPTAYVVSGGGAYCQGGTGVEVGLMGSNTGVSYQLYNGGMLAGASVAGNGGAISFGNQMAAGTYSVLATNTATTCTNAMSGSTVVVVNALPTAHNVTGGGTTCQGSGITVMMNPSTPGIEYQLMNGSTATGPVMTGTGSAIDFGAQTTSGSYMVVATDPATSCSRNMSGTATVVINTLPTAYTVTGGGNFCSGGTGVAVGLSGSATGISYQLKNGTTNVGTSVAGTGAAISFGMQTGAGNYTVEATNNTTSCTNTMTGTATITVNSLPSAYAVLSLGSSYCAGGEGVHVLLSGSDVSTDYQLMNGSTAAGLAIAGTGGMLDFGAQTAAGIYTVIANSGTCSRTMTGNVAVVVNPLPTAYAVTGGGGYCSSSAGAAISLAGSNTGISYQLYNSLGSAVGSPVTGTGSAISFGEKPAGTYMVIATNIATTCASNMTGTVTTMLNPAPIIYTVTGGGAYCQGTAGAIVSLGSSAAGTNYQLMSGTANVGVPVAGTGSAISFGPQTAGTYTVKAMNNTTGCTADMSGSAVVTMNTLPMPHTVTGGGSFCAGGTGINVGLATSSTGVNYQLYNGTTPVTGALLAGTGLGLNFGAQATGGNYTVMGMSTSTGCSVAMTGSANIVANALPTAYVVTGGGNYCATPGATGVAIGLSGSDAGISYQLYKDGTATGSPVGGSGSGLSFGMHTGSGSYTVMALNSATTCGNSMMGSATVMANPTVTPGVSISTGVGNTVCVGVLTTFTAATSNGGALPTYQWKVNGANVGLGLENYAYVPANGDVVSVSMTSSESCATPATASASMTMVVSSHQMPKAVVSTNPGTTVCQGTMVTFSVTPEFGGSAPSYVWKKGGMTVGTGASYAYSPANNDVVTVEMTSNFACRLEDKVTTDVTMTVEQPQTPVVSISVSPLPIVPGQNVTLTVTAANANGTPTFRWLINGVPVPGAVTTVFNSDDLKDGDEVTCEVTSHGACLPMMGSKTITINMAGVGVANVSNTASDIRLLPNPNNGNFIIRGTTGMTGNQELKAEVTDMLGQVVFSGKVTSRGGEVNERLQLSNTLANGMYILSLRSETETKTFHFVMQQ